MNSVPGTDRLPCSSAMRVCDEWHPSLFPLDVLAEAACVDVVVRGQGEATFAELAACMLDGRDFAEVAGIAFRSVGEPRFTATRPLAPYETLPAADYSLLPVERYFAGKGRRQLDPAGPPPQVVELEEHDAVLLFQAVPGIGALSFRRCGRPRVAQEPGRMDAVRLRDHLQSVGQRGRCPAGADGGVLWPARLEPATLVDRADPSDGALVQPQRVVSRTGGEDPHRAAQTADTAGLTTPGSRAARRRPQPGRIRMGAGQIQAVIRPGLADTHLTIQQL